MTESPESTERATAPASARAEPDEFSFLPEDADRVGLGSALPAHRRITVTRAEDAVVSAIEWGSHPPQVTLLHGAGLNAHTWDPTVLCLNVGTLAVDLPGHGDSTWRDDADYGPARNADAVADLLTEIDAGPQVVVGQSLGGLTGILLAAAHPELVSHLILVDIVPALPQTADAADAPADTAPVPAGTGAPVTDPGAAESAATPGKPTLAQIREFMTGRRQYDSREQIIDRALAFGYGPDRGALTRGVTLNTRRRDDGQYEFKHHLAHLAPEAALAAGRDSADLWEPLTGLSIPVLLIRGRQGVIDTAQVAEFLRRVPQGDVVELDSGHNVQEDSPAALADLVRAFSERPSPN
ncbi:alpha/beta hydrolase [Tersicoccus solisilvae]|uniref:Alpha/beta hydrolase n=1 Tax=Tersicoccus solisilvae TaxID=1882339 RepID=A0ABQ1NKU9_9MICC|nr:alpha/beta hydrolase [Tersicoccus solisilvae]GGC79661.1 alpha/beta hydrolase [Tersicoccus solisilvae]